MKVNIKISHFDKIVNLLIYKVKIKSSKKKDGRPVKYRNKLASISIFKEIKNILLLV